MSEIHRHTLRVYYEDTDMAGIVYYANYLRFIERGRSDWVRAIGLDQREMKDKDGIVFVVRRVEADYLAPARLDDVLTVETILADVSKAQFRMDQKVLRDGKAVFAASVYIVMMTNAGRPTRVPDHIRSLVTQPGAPA